MHTTLEIAVTVKTSTDKAWGIQDDNNPRNVVWLPKSLCQAEFKVTGADKGEAIITAPEWLLRKRELL